MSASNEKEAMARPEERESEVALLFDLHYRSLRGLAYVLLGDMGRAEEVTSEAFVKVFSGWNRLRRIDDRHGYLRQVVVNLCRSRFRRAKVERRVNEALGSRRIDAPTEDVDLRLDLWDEVRKLPERQKITVVLRYLEDLPEQQIANVLDCSVGTVKSQLSKAKAKLGKALAGTRGDT